MMHTHIKTFIVLVVVMVIVPALVHGQQLLKHTATAANTRGHITTIDNPAINGKPDAILMVSQNFGIYNPNETGVWYSGGKWNIFNENRSAMPTGNIFNILVLDPSSQKEGFVHTTTPANTSGHVTTIDHTSANGNADALVFVTQHYGKYNTSPAGVWHHGGKWKIYNEDRSAMPAGTKFNVLVLKEGAIPAGWPNVTGSVFQHRVSAASKSKFRSGHVTRINNAGTNNNERIGLLSTQVYKGAYNTSVTGVWYDSPNWTVFNQDRKALAENVWFNLLSLQAKPVSIRGNILVKGNTPVVWRAANKQRADWKLATKVNASKLFILPYEVKQGSSDNTGTDNTSTDIQGPDLSLGKDIDSFFDDAGFDHFVDKLNIFRELYEDKNRNSGYFYYLPRNYNLKWDNESGEYSFYIYYLSAGEAGRGEVIVTAELTPNINKDDISLAEALLSKKLNKEIKLRPLPLKDTPKVSFGNSLSNFDVDDANVSTNVPTDFLEPIVVSWRMGSRVDDFIGAMMNNIGIAGNINFLPHGEEEKVITLPVKLRVNDNQTFGKMEYSEAASLLNGFYNPIDYPVLLKQVVVLREKSNQTYSIQAVPLHDYEVEPKAIFSSFTQDEKNAVLNGDIISRMWVDYSVRSCDPCDETVQSKIMGGTSNARVNKIEIQVLNPLAYAGANSIKLLIKSRQGDPNGEQDVLLPVVTISEDDQTLSGGELFIPEGEQPSFEYQMVLINPDGETLASDWIPAGNLFVIIGESTVRDHFETGEDTTTETPDQPITDGN